jgi:maleylacetoacetate isomerase
MSSPSNKRKEPTSNERPLLYSYWRSSCSYRVRIALALKGIAYDTEAVHLLNEGGMQKKPAYTKLNPAQQVPSLRIDGAVLTQSLAIIEYLDERDSGDASQDGKKGSAAASATTSLLPATPLLRAQCRALCDIIACGTQPVQNLAVLLKIMAMTPSEPADAKTKAKLAWGRDAINAGLTAFEAAMQTTCGTYSVGDAVTTADLCLVPQVYNAKRFGCDMTQWPTITRVVAACEALPAFKAAHPDQQPDAVVQ